MKSNEKCEASDIVGVLILCVLCFSCKIVLYVPHSKYIYNGTGVYKYKMFGYIYRLNRNI